MKTLVDWIKTEMDSLGTPSAYSYKIGIYHGLQKVLKKIEGDGEMLEAYTLSQSYDRLLEEHKALEQQLTEKDATIRTLERRLQSVNETLAEGTPQPGMSGENFIDWMYSVLPFLDDSLGEGDQE